jgi:hypothetical protein
LRLNPFSLIQSFFRFKIGYKLAYLDSHVETLNTVEAILCIFSGQMSRQRMFSLRQRDYPLVLALIEVEGYVKAMLADLGIHISKLGNQYSGLNIHDDFSSVISQKSLVV